MDPRLDQTEEELRQRARQAATAVRAAAGQIEADGRVPRALIDGLAASGCLGVGAAEPSGGGFGLMGIALVAEELGATSASVADIVVAHLAALSLIEALDSDGQEQGILASLAGGEKLASLVLDGDVSLLDEPAVSVSATHAGDRLKLEGAAGAVSGAADADILVVPATTDEGLIVGVLASDAPQVARRAAGRRLGLNGAGTATVTFDGAEARALAGSDASAALARAADLERIGHAGLCVGIGRAALEASTAFVQASDAGLDRSQSVQWMLADMATETEAARLLTWYAASRSRDDELREAAAMARLLAAEAAVAASRRAVQIMGEAGNDPAAGVERLYRDAKAMEVHHGAAEAQRDQVARRLLPDLFE